MSTTIDQRVVEMSFDNSRFESNVKTSMGTIEKLKSSLNFSGAAKGLENVNSAAKSVNMSVLSSAVDTVHSRFSAMEVMAVTALANITNSAVNAGKRIINALTLEPVMSGFSEYETQINSVQTILANTQSKGTTLDDVNAALDTLNAYADKTIYNFTEMTRNIGTFTAAGIDLDTSVTAIQGIANLAAVSGSTSQQASTAMYQLSQALASGTVKLMDWNSVVNAGMGGQVFQDALKETARVHGVAIDQMIESEGSFRETLSSGWLTAEILTDTLKKFTMTTEGLTDAQIEQNREMLRSQGYTEDQINAIFELGKTATDAATKVKTFSQLFDTLKEAAQSGWTQTWEIIVGDFEEAKSFLTRLSDSIGGVINKMSESRNKLLEDALGSKWSTVIEKINEAGVSTDKFKEKLKEVAEASGIKGFDELIESCGSLENAFSSGKLSTDLITKTLRELSGASATATASTEDMTKKLEYFQDVVDRVWNGDFKDAPYRYQLLADAGYDYKVVQDLVNKTVDGHRLTLKDLSDVQLESIGYTKEEIDSIRKLADEAEKAGTPLNELIKSLEKPSGRTLLIESVYNIMESIGKVCTIAGNALRQVFEPLKSEQIYGVVEAFHSFTEKLNGIDPETSYDLLRAFKGLFTAVRLVSKVVGGAFTIAWEVAKAVLGHFNLDVLDVAASVGDAIVAFDKWLEKNNLIAKVVEVIIPLVEKAAEAIWNLIQSVKGSDAFVKMADKLASAGTAISEWIATLKASDNIPRDIISGLVNGLKEGIPLVANVMLEIGKAILNSICEFLGIHSPSTEMIAVGNYTMEGLADGIKTGAESFLTIAIEKVKGFFTGLINFIKGIDIGTVIAVAISGGLLLAVKKISDAFGALAAPFEGLGELFESLSKAVETMSKGFSKYMKAKAFESNSKAILNFAIAIGILAASVFLLTKVEDGEMLKAIGTIAALAGVVAVMAGVAILLDKVGSFGKLSISLAGLSVSMLLIAGVAKILAGMTWGDMGKAAAGFAGILVIVGIMSYIAMGLAMIPETEINKVSGTLIKIAIAMGLMTVVAKLIASMTNEDLGRAAVGFAVILGTIALMMTIALIPAKDVSQVTSTIIAIAAAVVALVLVAKLLSDMSPEAFIQGAAGMVGLTALVTYLVSIVNSVGNDAPKIATTLLGISAAMAILAVVALILGNIPFEKFGIAATGLIVLTAVVTILVKMVDSVGKDAPKIAGTLLAISVAIGLLAAVAVVLSLINIDGLKKGIAAVGYLAIIAGALVAVTSVARNSAKTIVALTVAIAVMAAAVAALSLIEPDRLSNATIAMVNVMGVFALIVASTGLMKDSVGALITMGVIVALLAAALYVLATLPAKGVEAAGNALTKGLLAFGAAMVLIGAAMKLMTGTLSGAASFAAMILSLAAAIFIISQSLSAFTSVGWGDIGKAAAVLVGALVILGAAGVLLAPIAPALMAVAAPLALFSAGLLGLAIAIQTVASVGPEGVATITSLATTIINLIPLTIQKLGEGIVAFANVIATGAPAIVNAVIAVVASVATSIVTVVTDTIPTIVLALTTMLANLLDIFATNIPKMVDAGMRLLLGILQGIRDHIGDIVTTAIEIIVVFLNAVASKIPDIIQAGVNIFLAFINGVAMALEGNTDELIAAVKRLFNAFIDAAKKVLSSAIPALKNLGSKLVNSGVAQGIKDKFSVAKEAVANLIEKAKKAISEKLSSWKQAGKDIIGGFIKGVKDKASELVNAAKGVVSNALEGAKKLLGINSPSKEFAKLGMYSDEGMILGLKKYAGGVAKAAANVGSRAIDSMADAMSSVSDMINGDMDLTPTIRPVIDLTDVKAGSRSISDIFNAGRSISVDSASVKAASISNGMRGDSSDASQQLQNGASISFTQNNYSPKALSKVDIYRQTKNQFSTLKGVLNKA